MGLLILMYHRVFDPNSPYSYNQFLNHFEHIIQNHPIIIPGENIEKNKLSVCLTFDDAYFDFHHKVYPLLQKYKIKALLGISTNYILENTDLTPELRLSVPYPQGMQDNLHEQKAPFCTWKELKEMVDSGWVIPASHTHTHPHLAKDNYNYTQEIIGSKQLLEKNLNTSVNTIIYPYGNISRKLHKKIHQTYQFGMRIGTALNKNWENNNGLLYRVDAENFWHHNKLITEHDLKKWQRAYWFNRIRLK